MSFECPVCGSTLKVVKGKVMVPKKKAVDALANVVGSFDEGLQDLLKFEEKGDKIIITPKQYLGSDNFAKAAATVRDLKGEYISAGKESRFEVLVKNAT